MSSVQADIIRSQQFASFETNAQDDREGELYTAASRAYPG